MNTNEKKRYHLVIPIELYQELEKVANNKSRTIIDVLRRYIEFGLWIDTFSNKADATLRITEGGDEYRLPLSLIT
jgi:predicted DNA-binding protein